MVEATMRESCTCCPAFSRFDSFFASLTCFDIFKIQHSEQMTPFKSQHSEPPTPRRSLGFEVQGLGGLEFGVRSLRYRFYGSGFEVSRLEVLQYSGLGVYNLRTTTLQKCEAVPKRARI